MLTDAERWELRARKADVEVARLRLAIAEAAQAEAATRIVAAHGLDPAQGYALHDDGTIAPVPPAGGDSE